MTWQEFWEVAKFCVKSPSMLIRNHPTSENVNNIVRILLENKKRVEVLDVSKYYVTLKFEGNYYFFWRENKFYSYLSLVVASPSFDEFDSRAIRVKDRMPSRLLAIRFFKTFDSENKTAHENADRPLLLPSQES